MDQLIAKDKLQKQVENVPDVLDSLRSPLRQICTRRPLDKQRHEYAPSYTQCSGSPTIKDDDASSACLKTAISPAALTGFV
jgi:hypothetical protein